MEIDTDTCAKCGEFATVLYQDSEGWITPLCETCLEKIKEEDSE